MSLTVGQYTFEGPYTDTDQLENRSGVYAITCTDGRTYGLIDVGESAAVKQRVENHDRKRCWQLNCSATLSASVLYTPNLQQAGRVAIENAIRQEFEPPCGRR